MNKSRLFIIIVLLVSSISATYAQCYELVWAEEFSYTGYPSDTFWTHEVDGNGGGNNELQYYKENDADNAWVEDGILTITAIKEEHGGRQYTSARIITRDKFEFQYGKIEARIRLPFGQGIWPAFWIMGDIETMGWPACGEIDVMEMVGGTSDGKSDSIVYGTAHWQHSGYHAEHGLPYALPSGKFADDFHVFSLEWTPTLISWYVDGNLYNALTITDEQLSEFHQDFFILLNLAVGGNWPGSPDETTVFPQSMEVDYVRVYQSGDFLEIRGPRFVSENATGVLYSVAEYEGATYVWTLPEGAVITEGDGTDSIYVDWGSNFGDVSVSIENGCGTYVLEKDVLVEGQYPYPDPYTAHGIPGTINATDYNYGGPGVAYYDASAWNEGTGKHQDEHVDTQNSDNGNPNVGWVISNEWMNYSIDVDKAGEYKVALRVATALGSGGPCYFYVNGEQRLGPINVSHTGAWDNFITLQAGKIALTEADTLLTVKFVGGGFNLGDMRFTYSPTAIENAEIAKHTRIYPNPARDLIKLEGDKTIRHYCIYNIYGAMIRAEDAMLQRHIEINIEEMDPGVYTISITHSDGTINTAKFVKSF